jgi:hypothetical protein
VEQGKGQKEKGRTGTAGSRASGLGTATAPTPGPRKRLKGKRQNRNGRVSGFGSRNGHGPHPRAKGKVRRKRARQRPSGGGSGEPRAMGERCSGGLRSLQAALVFLWLRHPPPTLRQWEYDAMREGPPGRMGKRDEGTACCGCGAQPRGGAGGHEARRAIAGEPASDAGGVGGGEEGGRGLRGQDRGDRRATEASRRCPPRTTRPCLEYRSDSSRCEPSRQGLRSQDAVALRHKHSCQSPEPPVPSSPERGTDALRPRR